MPRWIRTVLILAVLLGAVYVVRSNRGGDDGPRTQIVVQWLIGTSTTAPADAVGIGMGDVLRLEKMLQDSAMGLYEVDGEDYGGGTANIFLYATDPDAAVKHVVALFDAGKLRAGMRIGIADYTNAERTQWTYRAVYPEGLKEFGITYKP